MCSALGSSARVHHVFFFSCLGPRPFWKKEQLLVCFGFELSERQQARSKSQSRVTTPRRAPITQPRRASPLFVCPRHGLFCFLFVLCNRPVLFKRAPWLSGIGKKLCGLTVGAEPR